MAAPKKPVKSGDTLSSIAKANNTTVAAILADPRNATIAARVEAGTTPIFSGSKVAIPEAAKPAASTAAPAGDSRAALARLTSGQTLTPQDRVILGLGGSTTDSAAAVTPTGTDTGLDAPISGDGKILGTEDADVGQGEDPNLEPDTGKTFTWTDPDTGQTRTFNSAEELTAFVTSWSTNKTISANQNAKAEEERLRKERDNAAKKSAQEEFRAALTELGLGDLADTVDDFIRQDFTAAQIKLELPKQPAYKLRFPGMQALRDAGQAINEATYISMERGYIQTLGAYGLDANVFGTRSELGKYIANMVSPREFEERVNIAKTRVADNTDVVKQLKGYYPEIDDAAVVSYLLNPTKGMDIIKKQVRAAEIGAAATFAGFSDLGGKGAMGTGYAESLIGATGTADLAALKRDFGQAKTLARTQSRLAGIEGNTYNDTEAVNAAIAQEQSSILASQRRAERETKFRFGGTSGVGSSSLRSTTNQ
jgi:hypothetical protein